MHYNYNTDTRSFYIHWPFCPYKCHFCPFVAFANQDHLMTRYHEALLAEIGLFANSCRQAGKKLDLETIYFGGGTPSTYPTHLLLDTLCILKNEFNLKADAEITIEVNPGTVSQEQLRVWKTIGINRLSIGVQSLNDAVLKKLNRHQSAQDVVRVLDMAKNFFDNVSVDFIVGLPGVSDVDWKEMIETAVTWPISHISVYFLTVHEHTALYFRVKQKIVELPCDDLVVDLYHWTRDRLVMSNFEQYEISSFARVGYESRHNRVYWNRKPFKGFGVGAWSFDGISRFENEKNLVTYLKLIEEKQDIVAVGEQLSDEQIYIEKIMLGLRQIKGVLLTEMEIGLSESRRDSLRETIEILKKEGFIVARDGRIAITPMGLSVENSIARRLSL